MRRFESKRVEEMDWSNWFFSSFAEGKARKKKKIDIKIMN